jgi:H+-transporting ATPase
MAWQVCRTAAIIRAFHFAAIYTRASSLNSKLARAMCSCVVLVARAKPDSFKISRLFGVSGSLGILMVIESAVLTVAGLSYFGLTGSVDKIYTFGFAYLNLAGVFTLMIVRERNHFWKSRPSNFLSITVTAEILFVIAISLLGFLELAPLGYIPVLTILGFTLIVTFLINDPVKVYLIRKFKSGPQ